MSFLPDLSYFLALVYFIPTSAIALDHINDLLEFLNCFFLGPQEFDIVKLARFASAKLPDSAHSFKAFSYALYLDRYFWISHPRLRNVLLSFVSIRLCVLSFLSRSVMMFGGSPDGKRFLATMLLTVMIGAVTVSLFLAFNVSVLY